MDSPLDYYSPPARRPTRPPTLLLIVLFVSTVTVGYQLYALFVAGPRVHQAIGSDRSPPGSPAIDLLIGEHLLWCAKVPPLIGMIAVICSFAGPSEARRRQSHAPQSDGDQREPAYIAIGWHALLAIGFLIFILCFFNVLAFER